MSKSFHYNQAKALSKRLNLPLEAWVGTTKNFWEQKVKKLNTKIKREGTIKRNRLIKLTGLARELGRKPTYRSQDEGSSEQFLTEIKRLQSMQRRGVVRPNFNNLIDTNQFQQILNNVKAGSILTNNEAERFWNKLQGEGRYTINVDNNTFAVNPTTRNIILKWLTEGINQADVDEYPGDYEGLAHYIFNSPRNITIERYVSAPRQKNKNGKFFPFINTTDLDLSEYQIYNQEQSYNCEKREHCLIYSLIKCGISNSLIENVKMTFIAGNHFKKNDLTTVSKIINKKIILHHIANGEKRKDTYGDKSLPIIEIAIHSNHYFIYENTKWSQYYIKHYDHLKDFENGPEITKIKKVGDKYYYSTKEKTKLITSLQLVETFYNEKYFQKLDLTKFEETSSHIDLKEHIYLDNIENEQREFIKDDNKKIKDFSGSSEGRDKKDKNKENEKRTIYFADCESFINGESHELYLLGVVSVKNDFVDILNMCDKRFNFNTQEMVNHFLRIVSAGNEPIVYFHFIKYDYHLLEKYLNISSKVEKDNQLYSFKCIANNKVIEFRDSYKIASFPLAKFGSEFSLPKDIRKKEAIAYKYYTKENNNKIINIEEYSKYLPNDQLDIFKDNIKDFEKDGKFDPTEYYKYYLKYDCLVLKKGLLKFDELILEITNNKFSIFDCLTISSLADKYLIDSGAYDGVYEVKGNLRAYIGKAISGGRVHVNEKYKKKVINKKLADYDGVSLYPSAIDRLCREAGFVLGKAKRFLNNNNNNNNNKFDFAIFTIKINSVNKHQQMPFILHREDGKSSEYLNTAPKEPIIIDSITLEDYIKFHEIEYEILDGVYWDEGYNKKAGEIVKHLYQARLKCKKEGNNALSGVIKLILNSLYGKTIMKKSKNKDKIVKNKNFQNYVSNNFNTITSWRKMNDWVSTVKEVAVDDSYNRSHIGCAILSMSKRIMNEVFEVANDNKLPIYYTDTDSIHIGYDDVKILEEKYKLKYNRELNGKQLGQFHVDFNMKGAVGEIYSIKSIFLGKKSYIDKLESKDKDGNIINDYHIRLKGITEAGLNDAIKKEGGDPFKLFEDLANEISKDIILNPFDEDNNKEKVLFQFLPGGVSTRKEFIRTIKF